MTSTKLIQTKIYMVRDHKVMFDFDLSELYGVTTKVLNQAASRNKLRFPSDFMFQLNKSEFEILKSQIVTSSWGGIRRPPYAFTEQGVAMLSGVLRSKRAIQVNIGIMRAFVEMREALITHKELARKLNDMEKKYDHQFAVVFDAIRKLMSEPPVPKKNQIGYIKSKD